MDWIHHCKTVAAIGLQCTVAAAAVHIRLRTEFYNVLCYVLVRIHGSEYFEIVITDGVNNTNVD